MYSGAFVPTAKRKYEEVALEFLRGKLFERQDFKNETSGAEAAPQGTLGRLVCLAVSLVPSFPWREMEKKALATN